MFKRMIVSLAELNGLKFTLQAILNTIYSAVLANSLRENGFRGYESDKVRK